MATQSKIIQYNAGQDTWHPVSDVLTGTSLSTNGTVVTGIGTQFLAEVGKGAWLVNTDSQAARRVKYVVSDTELTLESPFSNDLVDQPVEFISKDAAKMIYFIMIPQDGGEYTLYSPTEDGVDYSLTVPYEDGQPNLSGRNYKFTTPVFVEVDGGSLIIQTEWYGNTIGG